MSIVDYLIISFKILIVLLIAIEAIIAPIGIRFFYANRIPFFISYVVLNTLRLFRRRLLSFLIIEFLANVVLCMMDGWRHFIFLVMTVVSIGVVCLNNYVDEFSANENYIIKGK